MQAITILTKGRPTGTLIPSARKFGIDLLVLQQQVQWTNFYHNKVMLLRDILANQSTNVFTVLYCDASDAFFTRANVTEESFEMWWKLFDRLRLPPVTLVSGESNCHPWPKKHGPHYTSTNRMRYPNAGVWCGKRESIVAEFDVMMSAAKNDDGYSEGGGFTRNYCDQQGWHEAVIAGRATVEESESWCLNLYNLTEAEARESIAKNNPCIIHGSSPGTKPLLHKLYKEIVG